MIQGVYPGSLAISPQYLSKIQDKVQKLYALYKKYFNAEISLPIIQQKLKTDRKFLGEIVKMSRHREQIEASASNIMKTTHFKSTIDNFLQEARRLGLIDKELGRGKLGLVVLIKDGDEELVVKLPLSPFTDFAGSGHISFELEHDHSKAIAQIDGINHNLVSQPLDNLCQRGKLLVFGKMSGRPYFNENHILGKHRPAFREYMGLMDFNPRNIADLIKVYAEAFRSGQATLSYGAVRNTMLLDQGQGLALYDLCPEPPNRNDEAKQRRLQQKMFTQYHLANAIYQVLSNGNLLFYTDSHVAAVFNNEIVKISPVDQGREFYEMRENLLKTSLQLLIDEGYISRAALQETCEYLKGLNDRINDQDADTLFWAEQGRPNDRFNKLMNKLIEHFQS